MGWYTPVYHTGTSLHQRISYRHFSFKKFHTNMLFIYKVCINSYLQTLRVCIGDQMVTFLNRNPCLETYRLPATNRTLSHHMLNSPTSAAYCTLFFFWVHLQEGFDVTTSDFNTYTIPKYHVLVRAITNTWQSNIRSSHN